MRTELTNSMMLKDKNMIDPMLLLGSPMPPPTRPPPRRPASPAANSQQDRGDACPDSVRIHHPPTEVQPDDRFKHESRLDYLSCFPAPPYKTPPRSQQSHESQECHTTHHWPTIWPEVSQQLNAPLLKRTRSLGKQFHTTPHPIVSRQLAALQPTPNPISLPSPSTPQLSSSSRSPGSSAEAHPLLRCSSIQTLSSTPPNPFHSDLQICPLECYSDRHRSTSLPSADNQGTCSDSLHSALSEKIGRLEFGEHWINQQADPSEKSKPLDLIASDLDYSFRKLININVFQQLLEEPAGRQTFRQAIVDGLSPNPNLSLAKLDLWLDCRGINQLLELVKSCSLGLNDLYLNSNSEDLRKILPDSTLNELDSSIRTIQSLKLNPTGKNHGISNVRNFDEEGPEDGRRQKERGIGVEEQRYEGNSIQFKSIETHLLRSLYQNEFPLYIKKTLISNVKVRLGKVDLNDAGQDGMGECFCLTNPRLRDHPIVLVSDGFTKVTGYDRDSIIGKNCRFLQGPGTAPQSVQRIRDGLNSGKGCTELLLNYRRDGTPFYCLLTIIPFRDITGALIYFIGGQINVTGMLSSKKGLSFLMTDPNGKTFEPSTLEGSDNLLGLNQHSLSQKMQEYNYRETLLGSESKLVLVDIKNQGRTNEHNAAGSITFDPLAHDKENSSFPKRLFRRLAGINNRDQRVDAALLATPSDDQKLVGAEGWFHDPKPLNEHIKNFEMTYSQLLIFKRNTKRVIFATKEAVDLFGLNNSLNTRAIYNSKLIQSDFVQLIWPFTPHSKSSVSHLRNRLKKIIKCGVAMSLDCQVKLIEHKNFFSTGKDEHLSGKLKPTTIHLTPLKDKDGNPVAFTCLFAPRNLV